MSHWHVVDPNWSHYPLIIIITINPKINSVSPTQSDATIVADWAHLVSHSDGMGSLIY